MINSNLKPSELPKSIKAERFYPFTEMLTDACERIPEQAARTKQKDEGSKAAVVPLLNLLNIKLFFDPHIFEK